MNRLNGLLMRLWLPALLLALWWVFSQGSRSNYFPALRKILGTFISTWTPAELASTVWPSVSRLLLAFVIAIVAGLGGGIAIALSDRASRMMTPFAEFFRAMPVAAMVPVGLVILGPGTTMEVTVIAFGSCWPILVATTDGIRGVDPLMVETARVYGLTARQRLVRIILPAALPQIASGLRIAIAAAIATMLVANMFGSNSGIGYFVMLAQQSFDILSTWAGLLMIGFIGVVLNSVFNVFQHRALAWHRGWRGASDL